MNPHLQKGPMSPEERKAAFERFSKNEEFFPKKKAPPEFFERKAFFAIMMFLALAFLAYDWLNK